MSFQSRNPSTGIDLHTYPSHDETEIEDRLTLSAASWKSWSATPLSERAVPFVRLAALLEERSEQYGRLITLEMGKPIGDAIAEVKKAALGARHFAEKATE